MKIEDVMTRRVVAARADTDLAHVARLMWDNDCGSVPVVDAEDKVVGIVTDRDVCMGANFAGRALRELRAADCMAGEVVTVRPDEGVSAVARRMGERRIRRVPVTDDGGRLIGIVSVGDLVNVAAVAPAKERKELQAVVLAALSEICARPAREGEVAPAPALPARKPRAGASPKRSRASGKKRSKV